MPNLLGKLHQIEPREQVGPQTGKLYEYQYHQAAAGALMLLDASENATCVYCEWHDDYVAESGLQGLYTFYQVKTKSDGPWPIGEFFGLGKLNTKTGQRPLSARKSSIFSNLWDHTQKFGSQCQAFVFLSDCKVDPELQKLLDECKTANSAAELSISSGALFDSVLPSLAKREKELTAATLFDFFRKLRTQLGIGTVESLDDAKVIIVDRILKASEVKLEWSEGRKMGADLVTIVRARSHEVLGILPKTVEELRVIKALSISDVLKLLSLSEDGFRLLGEGAGDAVRTLSRLHRFCQKRGMAEDLIPQFCELKTMWSAWWLQHAELVEKLDFTVFKGECLDVLKAHSEGTMTVRELGDQAISIASKYNRVFKPLEQLKSEQVMGFIISLAVEAER
jgi:Cap4 dsDNA endonuclease